MLLIVYVHVSMRVWVAYMCFLFCCMGCLYVFLFCYMGCLYVFIVLLYGLPICVFVLLYGLHICLFCFVLWVAYMCFVLLYIDMLNTTVWILLSMTQTHTHLVRVACIKGSPCFIVCIKRLAYCTTINKGSCL